MLSGDHAWLPGFHFLEVLLPLIRKRPRSLSFRLTAAGRLRWLVSAVALACALAGAPTSRGQAKATAQKSADLAVFVNAEVIRTDYAGTSQAGFAVGVDYTRFLHYLSLAPSLEARASYTPVLSVVGERVYSGGLKLETTHFRRFRPYGDFLAGAGKVTFDTPPGLTDRSIVYTYGGGLDLDLSTRFSAKIDAQASRWGLNPEDTRHPAMLGIGLVYHIPLSHRFTR